MPDQAQLAAGDLDKERPIVAGVSGGPDSLCLLDSLHSAGYRLIVAHFNHRLRPEADEEAAVVEHIAAGYGLPFLTDSGDVAGYAASHGLSVEEAARLLRYRFLFDTAQAQAAQAVAVGHTADDQAETVLMHFLRGAGLAGLKGMQVRTLLPVFDAAIPLVRPLLNLWRAETEAYCREHGLHPHLDPSNTDEQYFRNRLRHSLMPELEGYAPGFKARLLRSAEALQGDYALLEQASQQARREAASGRGEGWLSFDAARFQAMPAALQRLVFRQAAADLRPTDRDFGFEALERASQFAGSPGLQQVDFINGLYLRREAGTIYLAAYEADLPSAQWPQVTSTCPLSSPEIDLGNGWVLLTDKQLQDPKYLTLNTDPWSARLDAQKMAGDLLIRPPRPGDRLQPLGMDNGSIKLSDLFVNAKIPRRARAGWPVVTAGEQIAWVPGLRLAQPFRVTGDSRQILHLQLKKLPA